MTQNRPCPVCGAPTSPLDAVDFNKSCEELRGKVLPPAGFLVQYLFCEDCGFCFAPELYGWTLKQFADKIYNDSYVEVDPDYLSARPRTNARSLVSMIGDRGLYIRHLDYGGGNGLLSELLREEGWQSASYDPFIDSDGLRDFGKFDLITAYEVFEHVPDPRRLVKDLALLLDDDGLLLFSTLVSDGNLRPRQRLDWWYASPRNGHISLFSTKSLSVLGAREEFKFGSFSAGFHAFWRKIPPWAVHIMPRC